MFCTKGFILSWEVTSLTPEPLTDTVSMLLSDVYSTLNIMVALKKSQQFRQRLYCQKELDHGNDFMVSVHMFSNGRLSDPALYWYCLFSARQRNQTEVYCSWCPSTPKACLQQTCLPPSHWSRTEIPSWGGLGLWASRTGTTAKEPSVLLSWPQVCMDVVWVGCPEWWLVPWSAYVQASDGH